MTGSTGRYFVEGVAVGGPYTLDVRRLGFQPLRRIGIELELGQRFIADWILEPAPAELEPVTVEVAGELIRRGRSAEITVVVSESALARLPILSRNFADLAVLSPHVAPRPGGGIAIGGQNQMYNAIRIDGGENGDVYFGREPGGASSVAALQQVLPRTISLEAIHEFRILVTPFDVQEGAAAGGVLSAVTRSGTNMHHGAAFLSFASQDLAGGGAFASDFRTFQWGGSVGGPIVKNRVHYFASADVQDRVVDDAGPLITDTTGAAELARIGISYANAARFQRILADSYALAPGTLGPVNGHIPAQDVFAKLTAQLGTGSHLEISHHYAHAARRNFLDAGLLGYVSGAVSSRGIGYYGLSTVGEEDRTTAETSRLMWRALVASRWSNELVVSYERLRDHCLPNAGPDYPRIVVLIDTTQLVAGPNFTCPTNTVEQRVFEITDNVTFSLGQHIVTLGTHDELLDFQDAVLQQSNGFWTFTGLDSLAAGLAQRYERTLPGPRGTGADFRALQWGGYAQDTWSPSDRLSVTVGLRADVPLLPDAPATNPALRDSFGIEPGGRPTGNVLWSPRLHATFRPGRDSRTTLRGGIGLFSGRPPYRWVGNMYRDGGLEELFLVCRGTAVPLFVGKIQSTTCADGSGAVPAVSFFDPGVRFPQNLKVTVGADRSLSGGLSGTVELLYTRGVQQLYYSDINLLAPAGFELGEGGRPMYGAIDAKGLGHPIRRDTTLLQVIRVSNRRGDQAVSLAARLEQQLAHGARLSAAYAYSRSRDIFSLNNFNARPTLQGTPLDGTFENRRLTTSLFDTPHRVTLTATFQLPLRIGGSLLYTGSSGTPFTYIVNGDANADGIGERVVKNDAVYVPRDSDDITLFTGSSYAQLSSFIDAEPCLRDQRGRLLRRNSCRNPWVGTLNARMTKTVGTGPGRSLEIGVDVFNVLNLVNARWGQYRATTRGAIVQMLRLRGYDAANQRGIYQVTLPPRNRTVEDASRWQALLSARYVF